MHDPKPSFFSARTPRIVLLAAAAVAALALGWALIPGPAVEARAVVQSPSMPRDFSPATSLPTLALPAAPAEVAPAAEQTPTEAAPEPAAASWAIGIGSFGWQAELDACQWVLLDMVASVPLPIVAAHNYCGGGIVLEMQPGDTVALSGYGYDGSYVVTGSRDAWTGSDAASAVSGMDGDVVLQTCYWDDDGTERLVSLRRIG